MVLLLFEPDAQFTQAGDERPSVVDSVDAVLGRTGMGGPTPHLYTHVGAAFVGDHGLKLSRFRHDRPRPAQAGPHQVPGTATALLLVGDNRQRQAAAQWKLCTLHRLGCGDQRRETALHVGRAAPAQTAAPDDPRAGLALPATAGRN